MSLMERRLQLLLDQARYDRIEREARRSGRSVAAVIRQAIDQQFPEGDSARENAVTLFLELTEDPQGPSEDWAAIKKDIDQGVDDEVSR